VRLGDEPLLATALAHDPQEPGRERAQRLVEGFGSGRQRVVTVAAPVAGGIGLAGIRSRAAASCGRRTP
jgi:hypothetical protein